MGNAHLKLVAPAIEKLIPRPGSRLLTASGMILTWVVVFIIVAGVG
jgi:hypothetical protein